MPTMKEMTLNVFQIECQGCKKVLRNGKWVNLRETEKEELKKRIVHKQTTLCESCCPPVN